MSLAEILEEKRHAIQERWIKLILETYPDDTSVFLKKQKDRFANPVGYAIHEGTGAIMAVALDGGDPESVAQQLDDILRIRAVQHFSPARALEFLFQLKDAVTTVLKKELKDPKVAAELRLADRRVDDLALLGMDIYTRCREQVYELRLAELRNMQTDVKERILVKQGKWGKLAELQEKKKQRGEAVTLPVLHSDVGAARPENDEESPDDSGADLRNETGDDTTAK